MTLNHKLCLITDFSSRHEFNEKILYCVNETLTIGIDIQKPFFLRKSDVRESVFKVLVPKMLVLLDHHPISLKDSGGAFSSGVVALSKSSNLGQLTFSYQNGYDHYKIIRNIDNSQIIEAVCMYYEKHNILPEISIKDGILNDLMILEQLTITIPEEDDTIIEIYDEIKNK